MPQKNLEEYRNQMDIWKCDLVAFAYEAMRFEQLTNQQEALLRDIGDFVYANTIQEFREELDSKMWSKDPSKHLKKIAWLNSQLENVTLTPKQEQYIRKAGFAISAGRNVGKSCAISIIAWWFLCCLDEPQAYIMSPTGQQAKSIMMAELALWANKKIENEETGEFETAFIFKDMFDITSEAVRYKPAPTLRFLEVKRLPDNCSVEDQRIFLSGFHSKEQLFLIDEAVKFDDHVFETINATNADPLNFSISIFNPVKPSAYAVRAVHGDKIGVYDARTWSCEDSDKRGMRDQVKKLEQEYGGKNNDLYRVNVQGLPPEEGEDAFISMSMLERADGGEPLFPNSDNVVIGHDVAGMGSDNSATVVRIGNDIRYIFVHQQKDEHYQASFLMDLYDEFHPKEINIDTIGIGKAVYVLLKNKLPCVRPIAVSKKPTRDTKRLYNQRAQHYWNLREKLKGGEVTFNLRQGQEHLVQLKRELLATQRDPNGDPTVIKIEKKEKIKERLGGRSPDLADALMLAFSGRDYDQNLEVIDSGVKIDPWDKAFLDSRARKPSNWMAS